MATKWTQPFRKASFCLNPRMAPVKDAFAWGHHPRIPNHQKKICEDKTLTPTENYHGNRKMDPWKRILLLETINFQVYIRKKATVRPKHQEFPNFPQHIAIWVSLYVHNLHEYPACWMRLQAPQVVCLGGSP